FIVFFFFQAEDGIRDLTVTGVQTCALPICERAAALHQVHDGVGEPGDRGELDRSAEADEVDGNALAGERARGQARILGRDAQARSEERRVGKEWRSRWAAGQ